MELEVWLDTALAGRLTHDAEADRFAFDYDASWLARPDAYPLSPMLPMQPPADSSTNAHAVQVRRFFENLLPEGQALDDAVQALRVSKSNLAGLLVGLGRETAGAIRLVVAGAPTSDQDEKRLVPAAELSERIRQRADRPFSVWDEKVRLSIAGYQDKLALLVEGDHWYLAEGPNLASTHILKPEPVRLSLAGLTSNEFFCMRLAHAVGLPVAPVELHHVPEPVLLIERFDRRRQGGAIRRAHTIDGCQLLGLPVAHKYERIYGDGRDVRHVRDGASLPRFINAAARAVNPARERLDLLRWTIFNVLIGNADAHAKNLSFFLTSSGHVLAPAYDLVCNTLYIGNVNQNLAMAVGDAFLIEEVTALEWAQLCAAAHLNAALVVREIRRMIDLMRGSVAKVEHDTLSSGVNPEVIERVRGVIERECERQAAIASEIRGMLSHV